MGVRYQREDIDVQAFADILQRSGLAARRPVDDLGRLQRMLDHANLLLTARDVETGVLVGVARSLTDWSYACYLSDLAVDADWAGQGIGQRLITLTRDHAGEESMCLLVASPDAVSFYERIGMPTCDRAYLYPRAR